MILFYTLPLLTFFFFSFLNYNDCFTWGGGVTACMNRSKDNLREAALSTVWVPGLDSDCQAWCHTPLPTEHHLAGPTVYFILITKYSTVAVVRHGHFCWSCPCLIQKYPRTMLDITQSPIPGDRKPTLIYNMKTFPSQQVLLRYYIDI